MSLGDDMRDEPDKAQGLGGFDFSSFTGPFVESAQAERKKQEQTRIVRFDVDGTMSFHGFDVDEIKALLGVYRLHVRAMGAVATAMQSGADAVRYAPVGPEDVGGLDIAVPDLAESIRERREQASREEDRGWSTS